MDALSLETAMALCLTMFSNTQVIDFIENSDNEELTAFYYNNLGADKKVLCTELLDSVDKDLRMIFNLTNKVAKI